MDWGWYIKRGNFVSNFHHPLWGSNLPLKGTAGMTHPALNHDTGFMSFLPLPLTLIFSFHINFLNVCIFIGMAKIRKQEWETQTQRKREKNRYSVLWFTPCGWNSLNLELNNHWSKWCWMKINLFQFRRQPSVSNEKVHSWCVWIRMFSGAVNTKLNFIICLLLKVEGTLR